MKLAVPAPDACTIAVPPACVMLLVPVAVTTSVPVPTLEFPSNMALASRRLTLFAPVFVSDTGPVKLFAALFSVIAAAPVVKLAAPAPAA